jgi:hypothetical protein
LGQRLPLRAGSRETARRATFARAPRPRSARAARAPWAPSSSPAKHRLLRPSRPIFMAPGRPPWVRRSFVPAWIQIVSPTGSARRPCRTAPHPSLSSSTSSARADRACAVSPHFNHRPRAYGQCAIRYLASPIMIAAAAALTDFSLCA